MKHVRLAILFTTLALGCAHAKPTVICTMENPTTGARVELFKEIPYKVPAGYDEAKHIASWKSEQSEKGFTREVKQP